MVSHHGVIVNAERLVVSSVHSCQECHAWTILEEKKRELAMSELMKKLYRDEMIRGNYVTVKDFLDVKGRRALAGRTGRAVMCPDEVEYMDSYAGEVTYLHGGHQRRSGAGLMLVDVSDLV